MDRTARFTDDIKRYPVDRVAQRVTSPGPKWCDPGEKTAPTQTTPGFSSGRKMQRLKKRPANPTTKRLLARCTPEQLDEYIRVKRLCAHAGRPFSSMAYNHGYLRLLLGQRPTTKGQRYAMEQVGQCLAELGVDI